jgi:hypothetical protein
MRSGCDPISSSEAHSPSESGTSMLRYPEHPVASKTAKTARKSVRSKLYSFHYWIVEVIATVYSTLVNDWIIFENIVFRIM